MTEFFDAIRTGDEQRVRSLVESDPSLLSAKDENGLGPFIAARYNRRNAIADFLLERGVELDIFAACIAGRGERVGQLLNEDRSLIEAHSHDGWTPLHLAAFFGHAQIAEDLLERGAKLEARSINPMGNTALHAAASGGAVPVVRCLVERGADVNARQDGGWTALHASAQNGNIELVQLLIDAGADVKTRAGNNQSAMDLALTKGHQAVADILNKYGAFD